MGIGALPGAEGVPSIMITEGLNPKDVARFSAVLDREEFHAQLDRMFPGPRGHSREFRLDVLKGHRDRCTFDSAVETEKGWRSVIAKVYAADRSDVFRMMSAVVDAGFGPQDEFAIPRPLAYLTSLNVLMEEKVEGTQAMEIFQTGDHDEQVETARRCGTWLARFHARAPGQGRTTGPEDMLAKCRLWATPIREFGGPLAQKADTLLRKVESCVPPMDTVEACAGHGSYMPEHVILSGRRTVTIDLDEYDIADPARDVAWFIISLGRLGLKHRASLRAHDPAIEAFLDAYAQGARENALAHLPFHMGAECLHRAHRDLHKRIPPLPEWTEIMLDEGLRSS